MDIQKSWRNIERMREKLDDQLEFYVRESLTLALENVRLRGSEWAVYVGYADGFAANIRDAERSATLYRMVNRVYDECICIDGREQR